MRKVLSTLALIVLALLAGFFIGRRVNEGISTTDLLGGIALALGLVALVVGLHTDSTVDKIAGKVLEKATTPVVAAATPALKALSDRVQSGDAGAATALAEGLSGLGSVASLANNAVAENVVTSAVLPALRSGIANANVAANIASSALAFGAHNAYLVGELKEFELK